MPKKHSKEKSLLEDQNDRNTFPVSKIRSNNAPGPRSTPFQVLSSFIFMAVCFSVNHGCVTGLIGLASANFPKALAGTQLGTLYILYVLTALFASAALVSIFGTKWALVTGVSMYCFYVISFAIAAIFPAIQWPAAIVGAVLGGMAAGNLWTAQGAYFGETVKIYSQVTGKDEKDVTSMLSSYFAFCYLAFEVLTKLLTSILYFTNKNKSKKASDTFIYVVFSIIAVASAIGMMFIRNMSPPDQSDTRNNPQKRFTTEKAFGAINILTSDRKMLYMWFPCISFGILAGFLNYHVNGDIVKNAPGIGTDYIGFFGATVAGVAAISSLIFGWLSQRYGKGIFLIMGQICFGLEALVVIALPSSSLESWTPLFCIYALHGMGRATFEQTMRASFADIWDDKALQPYAFANIIISNGGATAACFFIFPYISGFAMGLAGVIAAGLGLSGYLMARAEMSSFHEIDPESPITPVHKDDVE